MAINVIADSRLLSLFGARPGIGHPAPLRQARLEVSAGQVYLYLGQILRATQIHILEMRQIGISALEIDILELKFMNFLVTSTKKPYIRMI